MNNILCGHLLQILMIGILFYCAYLHYTGENMRCPKCSGFKFDDNECPDCGYEKGDSNVNLSK